MSTLDVAYSSQYDSSALPMRQTGLSDCITVFMTVQLSVFYEFHLLFPFQKEQSDRAIGLVRWREVANERLHLYRCSHTYWPKISRILRT